VSCESAAEWNPEKQLARRKDGGVDDHALTGKRGTAAEEILAEGLAFARVPARPDPVSDLVPRDQAAADDRMLNGRLFRGFDLELELSRQPFVIVVQKRDPPGASEPDSHVPRVGVAEPLLRHVHDDPGIRGCCDGVCSLPIPAVHDDYDLDRVERLRQRAPQRTHHQTGSQMCGNED
jgi:hypothetical protein